MKTLRQGVASYGLQSHVTQPTELEGFGGILVVRDFGGISEAGVLPFKWMDGRNM